MAPDAGTPASIGPPADVFISYSHQNRDDAARIAAALSAQSLRVWWDRELRAGSEFTDAIQTELDAARVVLTLWSNESVRSAFVRDESGRALRGAKLLPVRIEEVELPLGFGQTHTLDLIGWDGDTDDAAFQDLLEEVQRRKAGPDAPDARPTGGALPHAAPGFRRPWRRGVVIAAVLAAAIGAATVGKLSWDRHIAQQRAEAQRALDLRAAQERTDAERAEADRLFRAGLAHQHAREPELVSAQNDYLSVLELRPGHARARYYLAHVYAQRRLPADALQAFRLALAATEAPLDASQRRDATEQVQALVVDPAEAAPVTRSADVLAGVTAAPSPVPAARPARTAPPAKVAVAPPSDPDEPRLRSATRPTAPLATAPAPRPAPPPVALPQPRSEASPPLARLPRSDPAPAVRERLLKEVDAMFGPDKELRISATTRLVVDPELLSDAVPLAVARALQLARGTPPLGAVEASGVVNTLVLLQSALPGTLEVHRSAIAALLAAARSVGPTSREHADRVDALLKVAAEHRPLAFLQIGDEAQRPMAQALAQRFRAAGYDAPGIELVGPRAPERTEVRVQGKSERGFARWVTTVVGNAVGEAPRVSSLRGAAPKSDTYEVWIARDLCVAGGRVVPACGGAPR